MTHRVSQVAEHDLIAPATGMRASQVTVHIFYETLEQSVRVSQATAHFFLEIKTQSVRASQVVAHMFVSMYNEIDFLFLDNTLNDQEVWGPELNRVVAPTQPAIRDREPNPYRPEVPFEFEKLDPIFYDFTKEQVETLRQQHMLIQAGDSTFGWEILTKISKIRHYTLGAVGRFYHDDYGIILARYVQFGRILDTQWVGSPVGRDTEADSAWVVTNDISRSDSALVAGVIGSFILPEEGQFGWIIIDGQNIQAIQTDDLTPPARDAELVWSRSFAVKSDTAGKTIARIFKVQGDVNLPAGSVWIKPEGLSTAGIRELFDLDFSTIDAEIAAIKIRVAVLESSTLGGDVTALTALVQQIQDALNQEIATRIYNDQGLAQRIAALESALVNSCCDALKLYVDEQNAIQDINISNLQTTLTNLGTTLNSYISTNDIRVSELENEVAGLRDRVNELESRPGAGLPLVTGEDELTFVVDEWNQLIFVEI